MRVALVEPRAEHDQNIERLVEDSGRGVPRSGVAENAERQFVILRKHAFGAQRRGDRNRPALGELCRRAAASSCSTPAPARNAMRVRGRRRPQVRRARSVAASRLSGIICREIGRDRRVFRRAFAGQHIMRQRQMHRPRGLRPHRGERMAEPVVEVPAASATVIDSRVSGFITAVSSSVAWLASWKSPSPSIVERQPRR